MYFSILLINVLYSFEVLPQKKIKEIFESTDTEYSDDLSIRVSLTIDRLKRLIEDNKNELITLKQDFKRLNDYLLDREIGSIACYLVDGNLRVCGDKNIIMSYEYESMVNRGLDMYKDLVLVLKKILNTNYNICILTDEKWDEEKKLYIENIKNKNQYVVQELKKEIEQTNDISVSDDINEASMLFGEDIVEVR